MKSSLSVPQIGVITPRIRPAMAPVYEFWLDQEWQAQARQKPWLRWGWCRLNEVVALVNRDFRVNWSADEFLQRFAISQEQGPVKFGQGDKRQQFDLLILWAHVYSGELHTEVYSRRTCIGRAGRDMTPYVSVGWVKDVLWALYNCCSRAIKAEDGLKVACFEDGSGVFYMSTRGMFAQKKVI